MDENNLKTLLITVFIFLTIKKTLNIKEQFSIIREKNK